MTCPSCGGVMQWEPSGVVSELVMRWQKLVRVARPAAFWACSACEHCEEGR